MSSIFDLKTSPEELVSKDGDVSSFKYEEYTPNRDVSGDNFARSQFAIPFELSSTQWWIPSRSYIRMRCDLKDASNEPLTVQAGIGANMNLAANLFSSLELQLNGKTISRCSDNVAAVDTLEQRLHKSKAWMDSIGASINFLQEPLKDRIQQVSSDGSTNETRREEIPISDTTIPLAATFSSNILNAATVGGATGILVKIQHADITQDVVNEFNKVINLQDFDSYDCKMVVTAPNGVHEYPIKGGGNFVASSGAGVAATLEFQSSISYGITDAMNTAGYTFKIVKTKKEASRRVSSFELIWKPLSLSVFKYSGALPVGKYRLIMTPYNDSGGNMQIKAIETAKSNSDTSSTTDFKFSVTDCRFYCAQVEGMRVDDTEYYLNLENTRLQTKLMTGTNSLSKNDFTVEPLTYALTVAFRDNKSGNDTRYSNSRFVVGENAELKLNRMYVSYAGKQFPSPDADPSFNVSIDNTTQRYIETSTNTGALFSEGGGESLVEWQKRGSIHYFSCPKDGNDRSTRCTVNTQFRDDIPECNLLLFSHSSAALKVTIQSGLVVDAVVIEA